MYTFDSRVRYSEIDQRGTLSLTGLVNYFQDCSTFQSEILGVGVEQLKDRGKAWVLSYWQIVIDRYPELGEKITVGTFAYDFEKLFGNRNFVMKDEGDQQIACANSLWVLMDMVSGKPIVPGPEEIRLYPLEPKLDMEYEGRRIKKASDYEEKEIFPVRRYHIDTNGHVNNAQYVQMALEMLPQEMEIYQVRVNYKKSAMLGDVIYPRYASDGERYVVELCDEAGGAYAIVEVKERKKDEV